MEKQPKVKKEKKVKLPKVKKEKKEKKSKKTLIAEADPYKEPEEELIEGESEEEEKVSSVFTPKERKNPELIIHKYWFDNWDLKILKPFTVSLELAYEEQKKRWEIEERISKSRREYLQSLYDRLIDAKIVINKKEQVKQ